MRQIRGVTDDLSEIPEGIRFPTVYVLQGIDAVVRKELANVRLVGQEQSFGDDVHQESLTYETLGGHVVLANAEYLRRSSDSQKPFLHCLVVLLGREELSEQRSKLEDSVGNYFREVGLNVTRLHGFDDEPYSGSAQNTQ